MQVATVIVLAAVLFIAANYYTSRFGLLWWVSNTLVFALVLGFVWLLVSMIFAPSWPPPSAVAPASQSEARE
jgi:ABC-type polysaccharide/polyol phosphate export permease